MKWQTCPPSVCQGSCSSAGTISVVKSDATTTSTGRSRDLLLWPGVWLLGRVCVSACFVAAFIVGNVSPQAPQPYESPFDDACRALCVGFFAAVFFFALAF